MRAYGAYRVHRDVLLEHARCGVGRWVVCTCYNMVVWAMLYYLVYQWRGGALRIVAFGNAALSGGTLVASLLPWRTRRRTSRKA